MSIKHVVYLVHGWLSCKEDNSLLLGLEMDILLGPHCDPTRFWLENSHWSSQPSRNPSQAVHGVQSQDPQETWVQSYFFHRHAV